MIDILGMGAASTGRTRTTCPSLLQWWRSQAEYRLDLASSCTIRDAPAALHLLELPNWSAAVRGDVCESVRIGMLVACDLTSPGWLADCAGSLPLPRAGDRPPRRPFSIACAAESSTGAAQCRRRRSDMRSQIFGHLHLEEAAMTPVAVAVLDADVMVVAGDTCEAAGQAFTPLHNTACIVEAKA